MILSVCTVRDAVACQCLGLKTFTNDAVAERDFINAIKVNHADFDLLKVAEYDTTTGIITATPQPIVLMHGIDLLKKGVE